MSEITVFFDGACPLCVREIALLRRLDGQGRIAFEDVSAPGAAETCPLDQQTLLARFHVQLRDGAMVDGARAFTEAYAQIRGLSWAKYLGRWGPSRAVLNGLYAAFLKVRPALQRLVRHAVSDQRPAS